MEPRFDLGKLTVTAGVSSLLESDGLFFSFVMFSIERHHRGIWGDICEEDVEVNEDALRYGGRLMSVYKTESCPDIWIITEADRSYTTVLFPDEY